jgi:hypothetical protein
MARRDHAPASARAANRLKELQGNNWKASPVKTFQILELVPVFILYHVAQMLACSLNPTANITNSPSGSIFHAHTETEIELSGATIVANCGTITEYRWRIDGVTVCWSALETKSSTMQI